jgi:hypothetical protein
MTLWDVDIEYQIRLRSYPLPPPGSLTIRCDSSMEIVNFFSLIDLTSDSEGMHKEEKVQTLYGDRYHRIYTFRRDV